MICVICVLYIMAIENQLTTQFHNNNVERSLNSCAVTTCPELNVDSGVIAYSATIYLPGTTATYSCSTGFGPNGGDVMRTCGGNRVWSGTPTSCDGKLIESLIIIRNIIVSCPRSYYLLCIGYCQWNGNIQFWPINLRNYCHLLLQ